MQETDLLWVGAGKERLTFLFAEDVIRQEPTLRSLIAGSANDEMGDRLDAIFGERLCVESIERGHSGDDLPEGRPSAG